MSASEKLKELHPLLTGPPARKFRDGAWDEIIAVVEAAEQHEHGTSMEIALQIGEATCPIDDALAALEEVLP